MHAQALLFTATVVAITGCVFSYSYQEIGQCRDDIERLYVYTSNEEYFGTTANQTASIIMHFGVSCQSVGMYGPSNATLYNMNVTNTMVNGSVTDRIQSDGDDVEETTRELNDKMKGWFRFLIAEDGSIPAVYYPNDEDHEVMNMKKALAATFQVNYNASTRVRMEVDPQSLHETEYRFPSGSSGRNLRQGRQVITRTITKVSAYASSIPLEEANITKSEDLELINGTLHTAHGNTNVKLLPNGYDPILSRGGFRAALSPLEEELQDGLRAKLHRKRQADDESYDPNIKTNYYEAKGTYSVLTVGQRRILRHKRALRNVDLSEAVESTLLAFINHTRKDMDSMVELRHKLGDINEALEELHRDPDNTAIAQNLESLVKKEARYGPVPRSSPAIADVLNYLTPLFGSTGDQDIKMRFLIYYIISPEGSLPSQLALVQGLENAVNEKEVENVLFYIAFVANPHPQLVTKLEEHIPSNVDTNDPMLLAYAAIVPRATPDLQLRMTAFLLDRLPEAEMEKNSLIHHILALGNTGSPRVQNYLLDYLRHPDDDVRLTSIFAMRNLLNEPSIQISLKDLLTQANITENHIAMMVKALYYGAEKAKLDNKERPYPKDLVTELVAAVLNTNDEEIDTTLGNYLQTVNTASSLNLLRLFLSLKNDMRDNNPNMTRIRKGAQWDEDDPVYNLVSPLADRRNDVSTYTHHLAYIWGKRFGGGDINAQIAAGGFAGVSNAGAYKVYGHATAVANCYDRYITFVDFLVLRQKDEESTHTRLYANVMGQTLKNIDLTEDPDVCKTFSEPLYEGKVYTVFDFKYSVFVEIGTLDFNLKATVQFTAAIDVSFCDDLGRLTAGVSLVPTVTLTVEAGGDLEILLVAKAGISVDAVFNYQLFPGVSSEVCYTEAEVRWKNCIGIYDQWKDSKLELYAWYAWRGWCGWWACTGDKAYQNKHKIDALTFSWNLPSSAKKTLYEACDNDYVCNES